MGAKTPFAITEGGGEFECEQFLDLHRPPPPVNNNCSLRLPTCFLEMPPKVTDLFFGNATFQCLDDFHLRGEVGSSENDHKFSFLCTIELFEQPLMYLFCSCYIMLQCTVSSGAYGWSP